MIVFRYAWRNLWRNRRRTLVTVTAVSLTAAVLIVTYSLMDGIWRHTLSNATNLVLGEVQIHRAKYLVDRSLYKDLSDPEGIMSRLKGQGVPAAARSYGYGLAASGTKSAGALFWGVDPGREKAAFDLARHVAEGAFIPDTPQKGVVLGKKLARSLDARVGSEIVVVVQAADGSLGNDLYTVTGILEAAGEGIDRTAAILHQADFDELFVSGGRVHEIALNTRGTVPLPELAARAAAAAPGNEVKTWRDLAPSLSDILNMLDGAIAVFGLVFFLAGGLGVMNTMLMSTFERIREFGLQKALGAAPWRIVRDVTAEALVLALVSNAAGVVLGLAGAYYFQEVGLDTTAFISGDVSFAGVAFDPVWLADLSLRSVLIPVVVMYVVCFLASLSPAVLAARLDPVKAMTRV
ncbi:MAG: FtsX-like permease family protein [Thermodesulfobacteriota bacterium]